MSTISIFNLALQFWGITLSIIAIPCLIFSGRNKLKVDKLFLNIIVTNMLIMMMDALALYFRGREGLLAGVMVRGTNYMTFFYSGLLCLHFIFYVRHYLELRVDNRINMAYLYGGYGLFCLLFLMLSANLFHPFLYQINDENLYSRMSYYPLILAPTFGMLLIAALMIIRYREALTRGERIGFFLYILIPVLTVGIAAFNYGIVLGQLGTTLAIVIMFIMAQADQGKRMAERENELIQSRIDISLSQIQPHFLYNTLSTIGALCKKDPDKASEATDRLTRYLRVNLDSMKQKNLVPFKKELEHIETYLYLEKMRFGDDLRVEYDLQETEFELPQLIVQPIVENAIVHGFMGSEDPVTIKISTRRENQRIYIVVTDDGCGFDVNVEPNDGRSHVGLSNVKKRLEYMVQGQMEVRSKIGIGTAVTLILPEKLREM